MKALVIIFLLIGITNAQTIYDVEPGTKGNRIILTVSNTSNLNPAEGVEIKLVKSSSSLTFTKETEMIEAKSEAEASFTFDINRNAPVNRKDTVGFMIKDKNKLSIMKSFIFNYTGPTEFKLAQNYPNPFNPTTTIQYQLSADSKVTLKVYDILGSEVVTLVNEEQQPGYYEVRFNGSHIASGMYIYRLTANSYSSIRKMMIIK